MMIPEGSCDALHPARRDIPDSDVLRLSTGARQVLAVVVFFEQLS